MALLSNTQKRIFVNSGHWDKDTGVVSKGIIERDEVKKIRDLVSKYLKENEFEVIEVPDTLDLRRSIDFVNTYVWEKDGGLALDIHLNWSGGMTTDVRGVEVYSGDSLQEKAQANIISEIMANYMEIPNRGWKSQTDSAWGSLGWVSQVKCWSHVIECLYLSHPEDRKLIEQNEHIKIAKGIVAGVMRLYDATPRPSVLETHTILPIDLEISLKNKMIELMSKVVELLKQLLKVKNKK